MSDKADIHVIEDRSFLLGLAFLSVAGGVGWIAAGYRIGTARTMGPGYFPLALALVLGVLALILIGQGVLGRRERLGTFSARPAVLVLAGTVVFALLLRPAGLVVAITAMVLVAGLASRRLGWPARIVLAVGLALGCAAVFVGLLGQAVPLAGPWVPL